MNVCQAVAFIKVNAIIIAFFPTDSTEMRLVLGVCNVYTKHIKAVYLKSLYHSKLNYEREGNGLAGCY